MDRRDSGIPHCATKHMLPHSKMPYHWDMLFNLRPQTLSPFIHSDKYMMILVMVNIKYYTWEKV